MSKHDIEKTQFFECCCFSSEHILIFSYCVEDNEVYTTVFLNHDSFFKRIINAIKYVFGYKCRYGHFDTFILNKDDLNNLINLLQRYKDNIDKKESK